MGYRDDLFSVLERSARKTGVDLRELDVEQLLAGLDDDAIAELLAPIEAEEQYLRFNKFRLFFPDETVEKGGVTFHSRHQYPKHMEFFEDGATYRERLFMAANRVGKAQPNDEPVLTPIGWRMMGELRPGDEVVSSSGKPTAIKAVYPQGRRPVVTVTASDGSAARCDREHLWTVRPVKKGRKSPYQTMTAAELQKRVNAGERWMLPPRPSVEYTSRLELPVDPYLVGLLLGDGGLSTGTIMLTMQHADFEQLRVYLEDQAEQWQCALEPTGNCTWRFASRVRRGGRHHNFLREALQSLGMVGCNAHTKRVPAEYVLAAEADRLALLQGLMDTDGTCGRSNGARQFYSVNRALCEDVAALARSLGLNASVKPKRGRYDGHEHRSWLVHIQSSSASLFRLPRKRENECFANRRSRGLIVEKVEDAGEAICTCIEVEASDSLYVTRDFLVTHNTIAGAYEMTCHLTGLYPDWWPGYRFKKEVRAWAAGDTNETTRDIIQLELLGNVIGGLDGRKGLDGSGMIPRECIGAPKWKQGVQDLVDTINIRHVSGRYSTLAFKSYDQGRRSFQGTAKEVIWLDEECPMDVYGECLVRVATTRGRLLTTFTPLTGLTELVLSFLNESERPQG